MKRAKPESDKRKRKTYLISFLDDATRIVPYGAFAFSESTAAFLPVFEQAIQRRGIPKRLYVDNGAAYRSHLLRRAGTELPLFGPAAIEAIFQATRALPRKVNQLAHYGLAAAAVAKAKSVSAEHVTAALAEVS